MNLEKNCETKYEKRFIFDAKAIFYCIFCVIILILFLVIYPNSVPKPDFLTISEYEMIEKYVEDAEEQQTSLARIVDSRELSEEQLKLIDEAIVELGKTIDALENILGYGE